MKTTTTMLLLFVLFAGGLTPDAAPARKRLSKQIEGNDYASDIEVLEQSQKMAIDIAK